jgi:citrate synthase
MMGADDGLYLTAQEAADELAISLPTLYAYVSRNLIRSQTVRGTRRRRYWKADIDRLKTEKAPSDQGVDRLGLVRETKITLLTDRGPYYRGRHALALAESETFESVAALLWQSDADAIFTQTLPTVPAGFAELRRALTGSTTLEQSMALFPLVEKANPRSYDLSPTGFARTGADVLRWFAAILVGADGPSAAPLHEFLANRLGAPPGFEDVIRRLLIIIADHEFDPSVYAVRAAANVGVTPYDAVLTGMIIYRGRRRAFARAEATSRFLDEIYSAPDPRDVIIRRFRDGEALPGFDSPVYKSTDPRAIALMSALETQLGDDDQLRRLQRAADAALEIAGLSLDTMLPATFIGHKLGLKSQAGAVALLGRMAGWIAHAMEQYHTQELVRPRATYTGPLPE